MAVNVNSLYYPYAAAIGSEPVVIDQVDEWNESLGLTLLRLGADGQVNPSYTTIAQQRPVMSFSTSALSTALGALGVTGAHITSGATFYTFAQLATHGGTRAGATSHLKLTVNEGMAIPRSIMAGVQPPAVLNYDVVVLYDGTNAPYVIATSQSLSGSPAVSELYCAGKATIAGNAVTDVQNINMDFGLIERILDGGGDIYATYCTIEKQEPLITITSLDAGLLNTFTMSGGVGTCTFYFRHCASGGARVADATETHISVTGTMHYQVSAIGGSHGNPLMANIELRPYGSTILTIDVTAAIT